MSKAQYKRVRNLSPFESKISDILLETGRIKDNSLLLNIEVDSEFLMLSWNQTVRIEGKREYLKEFFLQLFSFTFRN